MKHLVTFIFIFISFIFYEIYMFGRSWNEYLLQSNQLNPNKWIYVTFLSVSLFLIICGYGMNLLKKSIIMLLTTIMVYLLERDIQAYVYFGDERLLDNIGAELWTSMPVNILIFICVIALIVSVWRDKGREFP